MRLLLSSVGLGPRIPPLQNAPHRAVAVVAMLLCAALAGCASRTPVPDWQINAQSAAERAVESYLAGHTRAAQREFDRARDQIARTGSPALMARLELLHCAAQVGSTVAEPCTLFDALREDAAAAEQAYARYLAGQVQQADVALLPLSQQNVAAALVAGEGGRAAAALGQIEDPLSQLVAAGVLLRTGHAGPSVVAAALSVASRQGWRRPVMAWLGLQAARAEAAGDAEESARLRRRMDIAGRGMSAP